ncbi:Telomere-binding protein [Sea otter poxvirus]|uniref:Telomere-binding protein n=1 Tax=Sea otter poxvirus TaxID=1416741 RepID=A0A2U9QHP5_9POXV|nr:Telomere-binding protein [Sea otter poxvirus]AWU47092.1 Telomere-binding protein [Sea otter poxvirus]
MNQFIKNAACKIRKPSFNINDTISTISLRQCTVHFNFLAFYYNNDNLFQKSSNTIDDVTKSLIVMESYKYEYQVLKKLVKNIRLFPSIYVSDLFFLPIGWLMGDGVSPTTHAAIKFVYQGRSNTVEKRIRESMQKYPINNIDFLHTNDTFSIPAFEVPNISPTVLVTFYPPDPKNSLAILFFGRSGEVHCGIVYTFDREYLHDAISYLRRISSDMYILHDDIGRFNYVTLTGNKEPMIDTNIQVTAICEIEHELDVSKLIPSRLSIDVTTFVTKKLIHILDLPSKTEIQCINKNGMDLITHIGGKKLDVLLVIVKDKFLKDTVFDGVFEKENIIWRGIYTYRILKSSFNSPKLNLNKSTSCSIHRQLSISPTTFITRAYSDIV